jgi:DNA-binding response OmpR family regulator
MARILIAEDDSAIRQLLTTVLQRHGFEVEVATDGAETLRIIAEHPIDFLLLDLMMPILSGWNVLEELERLQHPLTRRMLIVTAASDKELEPLQTKYPLLRKPFDLVELLATVRLMMGAVQPATAAFVMPPSSAAAEA